MAVSAAKRAGASLGEREVNVSGGLRLAAAPIFLLMGGISAISAPGMTICTSAMPASPISEMALMYFLMAVFHLSPWLTLMSAVCSAKPKETDKCNMQ